jgi:hypothetical protein
MLKGCLNNENFLDFIAFNQYLKKGVYIML